MEFLRSYSTNPLWTRRECTLLGAKIFGAASIATLIFSALPAFFIWLPMPGNFWLQVIKQTLMTIGVATPPSILVGGMVGFQLHKLACGARNADDEKPNTGFVVTVVGCIVVGLLCMSGIWPLLLFYYVHNSVRNNHVIRSRRYGWLYPLLYAIFILVVSLLSARAYGSQSGDSTPLAICLGINSVLAGCLADVIAVLAVGKLTDQCLIAEPPTERFQFSLATMLAITLGLGAYMTVLVKIFGQ